MQKKRIVWFDILRGFFIFLALWHHWAQDLTVWYQDYFKEQSLLNDLYIVHHQMIGKINPTGWGTIVAGTLFTPWVNQIYLTMAAFNLASRTQEDFAKVWLSKVYLFFILFMFFLGEKFIVAKNLGEALALYPLMTWMVILTILSVLYRFTGIMGIAFVFILTMSQWIIPWNEGLNLEIWMQQNFHPFMNFDAAPHFFMASGAMGFLLGYVYYHRPELLGKWMWPAFIGSGIVMAIIGNSLSPAFYFPEHDLYETEHLKSGNFWGTIEILGIQLSLLSLTIIWHLKNINPPKYLKFLEWVGINSLCIFAFHRIFFIHLWMPIVTYVCARMEYTIPNNVPFIWLSIFVHLGFCLFLMKTKMFKIIMREKSEH